MSKLSKKEIVLVLEIHQKILERQNKFLIELVNEVNALADAHNAEKQ